MKWLGVRKNIVVPNVSWGMGLHECDILSLSAGGYATEIEIKISKYDLLKDAEKWHNHISNLIARLYFAVPNQLVDIAQVNTPSRAGILSVQKNVDKYVVVEVRKPRRNTFAVQWDADRRYQLARLGSMRILGLKQKILSNNYQ